MKKPVFSCSNVFDKRVTLHCHQYFENFLYMFYIQGVRKSLHILYREISNDLFQRVIQNIFPSARKRKREDIQLLSHQFLNSLPIISPVNFTVTGKAPNIHHFTKPVRKFLTLTNILFGFTTKKTIAHLLVLLLRFTTRNSTGRSFFSTSTHLFVRSLSQ